MTILPAILALLFFPVSGLRAEEANSGRVAHHLMPESLSNERKST